MLTAGIDAGMRLTKVCLVHRGRMVAWRCFEMKGTFRAGCKEALRQCLKDAADSGAPGPLTAIAATGYAEPLLKQAHIGLAEGDCLAAVAAKQEVKSRAIVDAGGLFIKIHRIDEKDRFVETLATERCASGSGRFLEISSDALGLPFAETLSMDLSGADAFHLTSSCAVFAESEVISQIGLGRPGPEILAGVVQSLAVKTAALMDHCGGTGPFALTGGLSAVSSFVSMLKEITGIDMPLLEPGPRMAAAYGAALIAENVRPSLARRIAARLIR